MTRLLIIAALSVALVLAGCGGDDDDAIRGEEATTAQPSTSQEPSAEDREDAEQGAEAQEPAGTTISTSESQFGEVLFDSDDQAIYYYEPEQASEPECYGECAEAWPPVLTGDEPQASEGAEAQLLGTAERRDGSTQVTYDGRPLYYYRDEDPGELRCHDVFHAGGLWLAVQPNGEPVPH